MAHPIVAETKDKMDKSLLSFRQEIGNVRTGRATPQLLDVVEVDVYGSKMKINQLGNVTVPDAHLLCIDLWDKNQMAAVRKAIIASPLDVNPSDDGKLIRIPIPPMNEERRRDMVKIATKQAEEAKVSVRNIRRHAIELVKKAQKDGEIPEDDAHKLTDDIQKMTDKHAEDIDKALKDKEKDIMEV